MTSGYDSINTENIAGTAALAQAGNRCSHDKNNLKMPLCIRGTTQNNKRPFSVQETIRRLTLCTDFIRLSKRQKKSRLQFRWKSPVEETEDQRNARLKNFKANLSTYIIIVRLLEDPGFARLFFHDIETKKGKRGRRSEGIESIVCLTLTTLLYYLDLRTMAFGLRSKASKAKFIYGDYAFIAQKSGLSEWRVRRSMKFLQEEGYVNVKTIVKKLDDGFQTTSVQIFLTDKIFKELDLMSELRNDQDYLLRGFKYRKNTNNENNKIIYKDKPKQNNQSEPRCTVPEWVPIKIKTCEKTQTSDHHWNLMRQSLGIKRKPPS